MDEAGKALDSLVAPHTLPGLESLRDHVQGPVPSGSEILCALETNHGLLVDFLLSQGWTVYPINPKSVDRYRERTRLLAEIGDDRNRYATFTSPAR